MKIRESQEDYLETILVLKQRNGSVRSIDIANEFGFSRPTVSIAMKKFKEEGFIVVDDDGYISLTDKGLEIAASTYEKHIIISDLLIELGVPEKIAYEDACHIEHCLSPETFEKIKAHWQLKNDNNWQYCTCQVD